MIVKPNGLASLVDGKQSKIYLITYYAVVKHIFSQSQQKRWFTMGYKKTPCHKLTEREKDARKVFDVKTEANVSSLSQV